MAYVIVPATAEHLPALAAVERQAAVLFEGQGLPQQVIEDTTPVEELHGAMQAGYLWIALADSGQAVGFAQAVAHAQTLHLQELAVMPAHGRRGLGRALVEMVCACARAEGRAAVTLTTFRELGWNAPFYRRLGFDIIPHAALTPILAALVEEEAQRGLDPERRVVMKREV